MPFRNYPDWPTKAQDWFLNFCQSSFLHPHHHSLLLRHSEMDLASLSWPTSISSKALGGEGFGGTVPLSFSTYQKLEGARSEISKIEKIEAPLKPEEEKEHRERELPPPEFLRPSKEKKSDSAIPAPAAVSIAAAAIADKEKPPRKKKKKTIF